MTTSATRDELSCNPKQDVKTDDLRIHKMVDELKEKAENTKMEEKIIIEENEEL